MSQITINGNGTISSDKTSHFECSKTTVTNKSHIETSIERLYGPGALGIGFRTRRSLLEQQRQSTAEDDLKLKIESPKSMPRVFNHLRPEFRSQLFGNNSMSLDNSDHKSDSQSSSKEYISVSSVKCKKVDGPIVHHIPIQLEDSSHIDKSEINGVENSINNSFKKLEDNGKTLKGSHTIDTPITKLINNLGHNYNLRSRSMTPKNVNVLTNSNILTPKIINVSQIGKENIEISNKNIINELPVKIEENECDSGGKHYLKIVDIEVDFLNKYADFIDKDINEFGHLMDEELKGKLLATVGKIRLLVTQKIKQLKGLCYKNIKGSPAEDFPTTNDDLAGFWDLVSLQIISVKELISDWQKVKENGWKEIAPVVTKEVHRVKPIQKATITAEQKAQIEARRKAQEERRKAMREAIMAKRKQAKANEQIEIFAPKGTT